MEIHLIQLKSRQRKFKNNLFVEEEEVRAMLLMSLYFVDYLILLIQNVCNVCPHLSLDTIKSPRDSQYIDRSENVKGNRRQDLPEGQKVRPQWKKSPHKPIEHAIRASICDLVKYTITGTFPFSLITTFFIPCQPFMSYPRKEGRIKNVKF